MKSSGEKISQNSKGGSKMGKKKPERSKSRLPREAQAVLRSRGGAHGTHKGQRGYNRAAEKRKLQNLLSASKPASLELAFILKMIEYNY
jgi:hypothetical protein